MAVPNTYQISPEQAIASYDWADLTANVGYKTYYAQHAVLSGATLYFLTPNPIDTGQRGTGQLISAGASPTFVVSHDLDFDLTYGKPTIVSGTAYVNVTSDINAATTSTHWLRYVVNFYHVTASGTETLLGTAGTADFTYGGVAASLSKRELISVALSRRKFKIGEKLRFNLQVFTSRSGGGVSYYNIFWDTMNQLNPTGSDIYGVSPDTTLLVSIPYVIDL